MVVTGTRKARAISSVVRPPRTRRVRATRAGGATSGAAAIRPIASIARWTSVRSMASGPSRALAKENFADLERPAVVGRALEPLEGFVQRAPLPQPVPGHKLLGLGERP